MFEGLLAVSPPPNKITGPNAGGLRQFPIPTPLAARVGQFCCYSEDSYFMMVDCSEYLYLDP
jgi:hypothetical protein